MAAGRRSTAPGTAERAGVARRRPPRPVLWAAAAWAAAVACGVAETVVAVGGMVVSGEGVPWAGLALRLAVYASAALAVLWFARGRQWARVVLAVGLGVIGLGTLVVPVVLAAPDGQAILEAMGYEGHGAAYLLVRTAHIASVLTAWALAFTPAANRYFRRPRASGGS